VTRCDLLAVVGRGERVPSFERVVMLVVRAEETSSAACVAACVICLISSSAVSSFGKMDLRLREVVRRVEGGGGESGMGFGDEVEEVGVRGVRLEVVAAGLVGSGGGGNARGWWRVETIIAMRALVLLAFVFEQTVSSRLDLMVVVCHAPGRSAIVSRQLQS